MKLIARAPIDEFDGTGDKRPGDTFDVDDKVGAELIASGKAEVPPKAPAKPAAKP